MQGLIIYSVHIIIRLLLVCLTVVDIGTSEMARPMSYHDGVVGSSYHTLVLNVQCFSLSTLKNQGYSCTHWHHGISHDPQVLPIWAVWKILCAEYDEESIGISIGLGKCAKGELFCLSNDDDAQCV